MCVDKLWFGRDALLQSSADRPKLSLFTGRTRDFILSVLPPPQQHTPSKRRLPYTFAHKILRDDKPLLGKEQEGLRFRPSVPVSGF